MSDRSKNTASQTLLEPKIKEKTKRQLIAEAVRGPTN